ncbi:hypothetical protein AGMMS50296_4910 [Alphaproteobacteria bacterium]|nr:hypothetical protein AGMMS50296_4910 [Alphaproteobacteria bacterium]
MQAGSVDGSLSGAEPSPGSSYEVTYRARVRVTPQDVTEGGLTVANAVPGTLVLIDYNITPQNAFCGDPESGRCRASGPP